MTCTVIFVQAALAANKVLKKKNIREGSGLAEFPDFNFAATKFLDGFRKGKFGPVNLDCDLVGESQEERKHY
jgi:ribosome biogenesis GTPase A